MQLSMGGTLLILLLAFGAAVAAGVPLLLGLTSVGATIGLLGPGTPGVARPDRAVRTDPDRADRATAGDEPPARWIAVDRPAGHASAAWSHRRRFAGSSSDGRSRRLGVTMTPSGDSRRIQAR